MHRKHPIELRHEGAPPDAGYGSPDDHQDYVDRTKVSFDPAEGLLSGTAIRPDERLHRITRPPEDSAPL